MISCRLLTETDLPQLLDLEQVCFSHPLSEKQLRQQLISKRAFSWGIFEGERLLAFAFYTVLLNEAELLQMAVTVDKRQQGYARQLTDSAMGALRERGAVRVLLEVRESNASAIALYQKQGFLRDGERKGYYPALVAGGAKETAILMSLALG